MSKGYRRDIWKTIPDDKYKFWQNAKTLLEFRDTFSYSKKGTKGVITFQKEHS